MFQWDEENVEHIAEHGMEPWEAEEALDDRGRAPFPATPAEWGSSASRRMGESSSSFWSEEPDRGES